ncbi:MAG TPA: hypothetical protein VGY48_25750 [Vicinamibacterales bacterium]|jgi:hypothetical protein|nr:hypothetical protein [Vicinamibacterales bacterium]
MRSRTWTAAIVSAVLLLPLASRRGEGADENATLLRVFLRDGSSLVSYGEPARVGDRVVFSMPTAVTPNPPLHLVNLPADRVDWERTEKYATAARASQYLKSQAELDYASLSNQLAQTLMDVASTTASSERLAIVERARAVLVEWPQNHYNYRQAEVRQMVGMLDEAIADLRAASGMSRFDIALSTYVDPPAVTEPLLPPLTLGESIEQVLNAARAVDGSVERKSLLSAALAAIDRDKDELPADWVATTRANVEAAIKVELTIDRSYRSLTDGVLALSDRRGKLADVRGVERLLARIQLLDDRLGRRRPEAINALVAAVEAKLDATRRLRLARDRWELRLPILATYGAAIRAPIALFAQLKPRLEDIKALSGSSPGSLATLQAGTARLTELMSQIDPPDELKAAHALLVSAAQLASSAVSIRREAALANDMDRAWNASSAAAGALMLGTRARADIISLLRPPQPQ